MEQILTVPAAQINAIVPEGVHPGNETQLLNFVEQNGTFQDRTDALENDINFKQIIPYITATCNGKLLAYQRTPKQTEKRLHAKYSIGFGGHINPEDANNDQNPVLGARHRELNEEVSLGSNPTFNFTGTINTNTIPVDSVHMAFAYTAEVANEDFTINEPENFMSANWMTPEQVAEIYDSMESWSKSIFSAMYPQLAPQATNA